MLQFFESPKISRFHWEFEVEPGSAVTLLLRVTYSNQLEELLRALVEGLSGVRLFDPVRLVVPNRGLKAYVELGVARLAGVSANVEVRTPSDFVASLAGVPTPESMILDRLLVALFDDALLTHPELSPVRDYIEAAGKDALVTDRRRVQLAQKLARLFSQYEVFRPELLECWRAGLFLDDSAFREVETWQRRLWLEIEGALPSRSAHLRVAPQVVHLVGYSTWARSLITALGRIAEEIDVFVYTLNPCQELWEAIGTPVPLLDGPRRYERRGGDLGPGEVFSTEDPFRLSNPGEILPLRLWGKPGRENLRLLNALTGCELVARMRDPEGRSLLHRLQRDIVSRKPERGSAPKLDAEADESIVFLECASPRRELEVIAAEIWSILSESAARDGSHRLRFEDIAVLLAPSQASRYQSLLGAVFRESHGIPYDAIDLPLENESSIAGAILQLLELPLDSVRVSSLVRFVTHPVVRTSFSRSAPEEWARLTEALGGGREGDVIDWDLRLNQLAFGVFLDNSIPRVDPDVLQSAAEFGLLLRSLLADAKEASRAVMTLPAWMDFVGAFLSTYVEPRSEVDERVLRSCLEAASSLAEMDLSGRKVRYGVAHELVRARIQGLSASRRRRLAEGVVVAPLLSMRTIPFRVVFVAGLSEPHFPARDGRDQLDLRRANRRAGDVSARDGDRYVFLETLLSARERIYLSWVSRDPLRLEPIPKSSVVSELIETLARGYVAEDRISIRRHPVERSEDPRTRSALPEAARESNARALGEDLCRHLGVARLPALLELKPALPDAAMRVLRWHRSPDSQRRSAPPALDLDLANLREFLECPLQGSARFHLRLREGGSPSGGTTADAAALFEALGAGGSSQAYEEAAERIGIDNALTRRRHLGILALCRRAIGEIANGTEPKLLLAGESKPLVLSVSRGRIEISRRPEIQLETPRALLHLSFREPERFHPQKESLKGFLDHVFSCAAGLGAAGPYTLLAVNAPAQGDTRSLLVRFAPIDPGRARSYLEEIASDLMAGVHEYVLPCEAVFGSIDPAKLDRTSSAFGPVPHPEDYPRLVEPERERVVRRRFGLYFETLLPAGETP